MGTQSYYVYDTIKGEFEKSQDDGNDVQPKVKLQPSSTSHIQKQSN